MIGVEAAAISAVVSGTLKIVGNKLAPLLIKEYNSIAGVKEDLQELHYLVEEIHVWLETTTDESIGSRQSFAWLKKLKDISYDVDDVVDEFQLESEKHDYDGDGGIVSTYLCKKTKSFVFQCKAANKIKAIKKRFSAIVKQRTDYLAITKSLSVDPPLRHTNMRTKEVLSLSNVDEESVVGRDKDKQNIISMLEENDDQQKIKIVSVIGLGGSGKTTLAKLVFNDGNIIQKHFEVRLWVHVSQEFDVKDLIKKLFDAFSDNNPGPHALPYMTKTISDKLIGKRFLLVLDDVWTNSRDEWEEFMVYIKVGAPKSRILLTTRNKEVAVIVGSTDQFHLPFLSPNDSWQLFQQSLVTPPTGWDFEFEEVGKAIVDKCGGVPLAIKALAGALHGKERIEEWQVMRDKNLSNSNVNSNKDRVVACLRLSYFHLATNLKQCFTICSAFPKGHKIDKEQLIDLWIAHDMITLEDGVDCLDLEYVGHKNFNSLLQVSFLQNVEEENGRVTCGMHDLVHDLALSILGDEISLDMPNEATCTTKSYRYLSLIKWPEHVAPKSIFRKVRAVYMPRYGDYTYVMALKHAKHLRSVMVGYLDTEEANTISQVKYLKYLAMSLRSSETLPKGIFNVWSLQALHVTQSYSLVEIPKSISKLKMLRTLNLSGCRTLKSLPDSIGDCQMISSIDLYNCSKLTMLPDSIGKLQKLRTLNLSWCEELKCLPYSIGDCQMISSIDLCSCTKLTLLPDSIGRNKKLRVLRLSYTEVERIPSVITTLSNLECLDLLGCFQLVELPESIGNLEKLQVLNLRDCYKLEGMPVGIGQLSRLQNLGLFVVGKGEKFAGISELANVSRIGEELTIRGISDVLGPKDAHMACLKQKTHIRSLYLEWMADEAKEVNTELQQDVLDGLEPPHGIKVLNIGGYSGRQYARWMKSQVGVVQCPVPFPFLRVMVLHDFPNLKHLHGLVELPCLEELELESMPSLESISGGPFSSLVKIKMSALPCLGEVWMVAEKVTPNREEGGGCSNFTPHLEQLRVGDSVTEIVIFRCPKLKVQPYLPSSLQHLQLSRAGEVLLQSPDQYGGSFSFPTFSHLNKLELLHVIGLGSRHGRELLQHMTALESLVIKYSDALAELPESLRRLTSLQSLQLYECSAICMLPESLGELKSLEKLTVRYCSSLSSLPQSTGQLTSLLELCIESCDAIEKLPEGLGELCSLRKLDLKWLLGLTCLPQSVCGLTSLRELSIYYCPSLASFPEGMKGLVSLEELSIRYCTSLASLPQGMEGLASLENLTLYGCPGIKSLPEGIKGLTALIELEIYDCPDLVRRCETGTGEDWHLISHIPYRSIWQATAC